MPGTVGKESTCQCRRHRRCNFDPWVGKMPWRRKWQPTSVFLLGKSHGQRSLAGYNPRSHRESDTAECTHTHIHTHTPSHCARQPVDLGTGVGPGPALRKALRGFMKIRKAESFTLETSFNAWQPSTLGSPGGSVGREFTCYAGEPGLIPRWGRSPGEGNGNPLQYFCLRNPMDRGA